MKIKYLLVYFSLLFSFSVKANNNAIEYSEEELQWADSVLNTLSTRQKIAQLIMLAVYSNKSEVYNSEAIELFENLQLGGIIFMQGGPIRQAMLCNRIQAKLNIPALIAIDAEYGLAMRLDSTIYYPRAMALSAINNTKSIFDMGREIGRQCKRMGIHVNFAPVLDVNVEPKNPIINSRSFGEDKNRVVECATAYANGMQQMHVLAVGKHFPGHGDTHTDSHLALPKIDHNVRRLNNIELYPFKKTANVMGGMLVAHLAVPALEPDSTLPSTLSRRIVDSLLIKDMKYNGLIFTDALNMRGVADYFQPGDLEVRALMAGNDVLLFPKKPELAINQIEQAIADSLITIDELNRHCLKVLRTKAWAGLNHYQPIDTANLIVELNTPRAINLQQRLCNMSITMLKNDNTLPIGNLADNKILSINLGGTSTNKFQEILLRYAEIDTLLLTTYPCDSIINQTITLAKKYNTIIISTLGTNELQSKNFGLIPESVKLIDSLSENCNTILVHLGNPYALSKLQNYNKLKAVLVGYKASNEMQISAAQIVFGGLKVNGHIAVSVNSSVGKGDGISSNKITRLSYNDGFSANKPEFEKIDSIVNQCIKDHIMPGCQLVFGLNGKIIYQKAYGYHTYDSLKPVQLTDIYDIASVTKVAATTTALMQLYDKRQFKLTDRLSTYVPMLKKSNKSELKINHILTHQAGLTGWIPVYKNTIDSDGNLNPNIYSKNFTEQFSIMLTDSLFMRSDYADSVYTAIINSPLNKTKRYKYSDLGFYLFPLMISKLSNQTIDQYCYEHIYKPLGMSNTCFQPLQHFDKSRIVPSEIDTNWRHDTICGYVNDQGAAMLGGVSGHAGLFSTAGDLAKLCQMWLNGGSYGDVDFFSKKTMQTFTKAPFQANGNRRAYGFDKPLMLYNSNGPTCAAASLESFGHTGFTGTFVWVDPKYNCFMVFLTNRTYPSSADNKLAKLNIRTSIQELFYQAVTTSIKKELATD